MSVRGRPPRRSTALSPSWRTRTGTGLGEAAERTGACRLSVTAGPQAGGLGAFDRNGGGDFTGGHEHMGIARTAGGSSFTALEGDTGDFDGGKDGVYVKARGTNGGYAELFVRVR